MKLASLKPATISELVQAIEDYSNESYRSDGWSEDDLETVGGAVRLMLDHGLIRKEPYPPEDCDDGQVYSLVGTHLCRSLGDDLSADWIVEKWFDCDEEKEDNEPPGYDCDSCRDGGKLGPNQDCHCNGGQRH